MMQYAKIAAIAIAAPVLPMLWALGFLGACFTFKDAGLVVYLMATGSVAAGAAYFYAK